MKKAVGQAKWMHRRPKGIATTSEDEACKEIVKSY